MRLTEIKIGERARIAHVGGTDTLRHHLGALGFVAGTVVRVVGMSYGNMILAVHESRVAVDDATAGGIEVEAA